MNRVVHTALRYDADEGRYYLGDAAFTGLSYTLHRDGSGNVASEVGLREGIECGIARRWSRDGVLLLERAVECGVCHGRSREWHPNGSLAVDEDYEQGVCLSRRKWAPDGTEVENWARPLSDPVFKTLERNRKRNPWYSRIER